MKHFNKNPIINLSYSDFRSDGSIKHKDFLNKTGLIVFYMPGCGYCQNMETDYHQAAVSGARVIPFGAIDGTASGNKKISGIFGIKSFPTIRLVKNGFIEGSDYSLPRTSKNFIDYACKEMDSQEKNRNSRLCGI